MRTVQAMTYADIGLLLLAVLGAALGAVGWAVAVWSVGQLLHPGVPPC